MNILLLLVTQGVGGVEKRFYNYSKYILNKTDHNYTVVISNSLLDTMGELLICNNNRLIGYGVKWNKKSRYKRYIDYIFLVFVLIKLLGKHYDSAHFVTFSSLLFRRFIKADKKVHSFVNSISSEQEKICECTLFQKIMSEGFIIDCLDERIKAFVAEKFPMQLPNIVSAPCSFINYDWSLQSMEKENVISFVGRLEEFKGIQLLVEIIPQILKYTNYGIQIFGKGTYAETIKTFIQENNVGHRVKLDYILEPKEGLKKSRIFLSLQKEENYPSQSLLEAMFCENAIIATDVGLTRKIVKEDFGILIPNSSVHLFNAIKRLIQSDCSLKEMGIKARIFAEKNHTVEIFHQYLVSIYS